jgi:hypothetical protein
MPGKWVDTWNHPELPTGIRIDMAPAPFDQARRTVVGVTVPLHITRLPDFIYADQ